MLTQDKILDFLNLTGPTLPSKVAKSIQSEILIASAHLSDLASSGKVKISKLKVGGSPLYYLPGQESQLYQFAAGNMNPKDLLVLESLKTKKILEEKNLDLLSKIALRSLKDFAVPLHVSIGGQKELFWKWHLLDEEETNQIITEILSTKTESRPPQEQQAPISEQTQQQVQPQIQPEIQSLAQSLEPGLPTGAKQETFPKLSLEDSPSSLQTNNFKEGEKIEQLKEELNPHPRLELKKEQKDRVKANYPDHKKEKLELIKNKERKEEGKEEKEPSEQDSFLQKEKTKIKKRISSVSDEFIPVLEEYFKERDILIEQKEIIRKNSEVDLLIKVPTVVGSLIYFCKAKNKLRCDEKDLSSAYMEAQIKKLPLLFLYKKDITKKVDEMLESGAFQNVIVKKME
ncbi:MAG: hypothetical protein KKA62_03520 [Nanoarchaeota archaeon]|nr:hypothetical protein [Nanoarchaeota archaeon]MBU1644263.1 hypothetical protein [Nanoarchaeota archaeon]MBU1976995.1 hypothetical protein [Nanoarchaeota archaeon]